MGIDNGVSGAIAIIHPDGEIEVGKMPTIEAGKRTLLDDIKIRNTLNKARGGTTSFMDRPHPSLLDPMHVVFEQGQLQPLFSCKTNFAQGYSFGVIATILRQNAIPATAVNPKDWMKEMHLGVRGKGDDTKTASLEACRRLYPHVSLLPTPRCTKPDDGMAEALLMATWGKRHNL